MKPSGQKLIKVKAPFIDKISGLAIVKMLDGGTHTTLLMKLKFTQNRVILDITNKGTETMIFKPEEVIGVIDLRSVGYCKIKQGVGITKLKKQRNFVNIFNKFVNMLRKEREQKSLEDKYLWLNPDDNQDT